MEILKNSTSIPAEISGSLNDFHSDYPDPSHVAFVMMEFGDTKLHNNIMKSIITTLSNFGIVALRADDKPYHEDLFWNIITYIYGCGFGIAVFERITEDAVNPNIALEVGYMFAIDKPVCLLKEKTLKELQTDLLGKLYRVFDGQKIKQSIKKNLEKWVNDKNFGLPIEQTRIWINELNQKPKYDQWCFRVNWPPAHTGKRIDAYSNKITCQTFIDSLVSSRITRQEYDSVLDSIKRSTQSDTPPQKLSGEILFSETSKAVFDKVQCLLGSTPYEYSKERHGEWNDVLGEHDDILPPSHLFSIKANIEKYKSAQICIAKTASQICKNVLCSIYQISISQALYLEDKDKKKTFAMVCTARDCKKENIPIISEIPVLMESKEDQFSWYGQPERKPTTEYQSHWCFHKKLMEKGMTEHLLIHFHPVVLLDTFVFLQTTYQDAVPDEIWDSAVECAKDHMTNLKIFRDYINIGARQTNFGQFIADQIKCNNVTDNYTNLIWKPDHGLWLIMKCNKKIEEIQKTVEKTEVISNDIAKMLTNSDREKNQPKA